MKPDRYKLWNPWAAAGWSLLFSPVFGAWLHAANWRALGYPDKAVAARRWSYAMLGMVLLSGLVSALFELYARHLPVIVTVAVTITWFSLPARAHCRHVREATGGRYRRRAWWPVLLGGVAGWGLLALCCAGAATLLLQAGGFYI